MPAVEIKTGVYWIGVNDRTTDLFEGIWPISKEGVSYNAYLVLDQKKALIDLSKAIKTDEFFDQIGELTDPSQLNFVVVNHLEPDHSGVLRTLLKIAPDVTLVCSEKCREMLSKFYGIWKNVKTVRDGETLSLGTRTLRFVMAPFVHWPETMMTYEESDRLLFSCDAFGSYGALRGGLFDDECRDPDFYEKEALRYYVNIVAKFSGPVLKAIEKLKGVELRVIAPSHGLVWRKDPGRIIALYKKWAEFAAGEVPAGITLVYASMYGNTEKMMNAVAQGISRTGLDLEVFDAARTHVSYILPSLWIRSGVIIGAPTYEGSLFPPMSEVLNMAAVKRIFNRKAFLFGSYGWSGGGQRELLSRMDSLKWDVLDKFEFCGSPSQADIRHGIETGEGFARRLAGSAAGKG